MTRIALITGKSNSWANDLWKTLRQISTIHEYYVAEVCNLGSRAPEGESEASYLYIPSLMDRDGMMPDLSEAEMAFQQSAPLRPRKLVLLSSALIYGTGPGRQCLVEEDYAAGSHGWHQICSRWKSLEAMAGQYLRADVPLTVLRPTTVLPSPALLSKRLKRRLIVTLAGHDPTLQLLSLGDLAEAILCAIERNRP